MMPSLCLMRAHKNMPNICPIFLQKFGKSQCLSECEVWLIRPVTKFISPEELSFPVFLSRNLSYGRFSFRIKMMSKRGVKTNATLYLTDEFSQRNIIQLFLAA